MGSLSIGRKLRRRKATGTNADGGNCGSVEDIGSEGGSSLASLPQSHVLHHVRDKRMSTVIASVVANHESDFDQAGIDFDKISPAELDKVVEGIKKEYDVDQDGRIDDDELKEMVRSVSGVTFFYSCCNDAVFDSDTSCLYIIQTHQHSSLSISNMCTYLSIKLSDHWCIPYGSKQQRLER